MPDRRWRLWLCALCVCLVGCDTVQWTYNHARWLVVPKLKGVADFTDAQEKLIDAEFDKYMKWHRRTMMPAYATVLRQAATVLQQPISTSAVQQVRQAWSQAWVDTMAPTLEPAARVLTGLDAGQLPSLEQHFAEEDSDAAKDLAKKSRSERQKKRDHELLDKIDDWSGGLRASQRQALEMVAHTLPLRDDVQLADRRQLRAELLVKLRQKATPAQVAQFFSTWLAERRRRMDAETGPGWTAFLEAVVRTLDTPQKQRLAAKLTGYAQDCEALSRQ